MPPLPQRQVAVQRFRHFWLCQLWPLIAKQLHRHVDLRKDLRQVAPQPVGPGLTSGTYHVKEPRHIAGREADSARASR